MADAPKYVYSFGGGTAEGRCRHEGAAGRQGGQPRRDELDRHPGASRLHDHDVVCADYYERGRQLPEEVKPQVEAALARMEALAGKKFGNAADPLLVSVRSGAALSMPGMMNTILNLGLERRVGRGPGAGRRAIRDLRIDGYRRLIDMFGSTAMGVEHEAFEHELAALKEERGVKLDTDLERRRPEGAGRPLQGRLREARRPAVSAGPQGSALEVDHGGLQ